MSEYTLYRNLCDMGFSQDRASRATDILLGRDDQLPGEETQLDAEADDFEPSEDDLLDYREWCEAIDRRWDEQYRFTEADARAAGLAV